MKIYIYTSILEMIRSSILLNSAFMIPIIFLSLYAEDYFMFKVMICFNIALFVLNYAIKSFVMFRVRKFYRSGKITYNEVKAVSNIIQEASIC